jgi:serine/threonine-protein kinase
MEDPVRPGEILAEKYRVDQVLGVGGMGVVVAATHLELEQKVALKFMHANAYITEEARNRFLREARIASKLRSEHVARVTDTGVLANGAPYIVMEYLEGVDLSVQLTQHGPMPLGYAAECIVQACDAVGEAHAHGIVHRDLKPANLFLTQHTDGSPLIKVLDFGISKATQGVDGAMAMTKTGALLGSPLYMSPEQMRSLKTVDARTDVWALGVILFELLTGTTPFNADNFGDLLVLVMTSEPSQLHSHKPDMPAEVAALIQRCLTKDPALRVQSVAEIAGVLAPFCSASGVVLAQRIHAVAQRSGTTGDPRVTGTPQLGGGTHAGWGGASAPGVSPQPSSAWMGWVAGLAGLLVIGGGIAALTRAHGATSDSSATTAAPTRDPSGVASASVIAMPPPTGAPSSTAPPISSAPTPTDSASAAVPLPPEPAVGPQPAPRNRASGPVVARPAASPAPSHAPQPTAAPTPRPAASAPKPPGVLETSE